MAAVAFDPYQEWLGIGPLERPANHYRLLGLRPFETDPVVIRRDAQQRLHRVKDQLYGPHKAEAEALLREMLAAAHCLLEPAQKAAYDAQLRPTLEKANRWKVSDDPAAASTFVSASDLEHHEQEEGAPVTVRSRLVDSEMDMTPMVDVTFQLLIFFMVTASFLIQKSIRMPAPKDSDPSTAAQEVILDEEPDFVTVRIDHYNTYTVVTPEWEEDAPSEHDLLILLRRARQEEIAGEFPTRMRVEANSEALHRKVVSAIDAGVEVGMENIQLATTEDDE